MSEALNRHEQDLLKVAELRKLQQEDWKRQIQMQDDIDKLEAEQKSFMKTRLHEELLQQMREA